jgi:hypothetical protein
METNMFIPIGVKFLVLILSALAVSALAAWELVVEWLRGVARLFLSIPQRPTKGTSREEIKLGKRSLTQLVN